MEDAVRAALDAVDNAAPDREIRLTQSEQAKMQKLMSPWRIFQTDRSLRDNGDLQTNVANVSRCVVTTIISNVPAVPKCSRTIVSEHNMSICFFIRQMCTCSHLVLKSQSFAT